MKMLNLSIITAAIIGAVSVNAANQTTTIYQTGNGNSADALQSSSNSVLIDVTQKGTKNSSTSTQIGASKSDTVIYQSGSLTPPPPIKPVPKTISISSNVANVTMLK